MPIHRRHATGAEQADQVQPVTVGSAPDEGFAVIAKQVARAVAGEVDRHFRFEEEQLFPRLAAGGEVDLADLLLDEHKSIRATAADLLPGGPGSRLENVLSSLNAGYQGVTAAIPNRYDFSEGETRHSIEDGGDDMYDGGNHLSTDLGGPFDYSNNTIVNSNVFGPQGRYFTRKYSSPKTWTGFDRKWNWLFS